MGTRSINAPLSPNEELTLRRIVIGIATIEELSESQLARLRNGGLLDEDNRLTPAGRERYDSLQRPPRSGHKTPNEAFRTALRSVASIKR